MIFEGPFIAWFGDMRKKEAQHLYSYAFQNLIIYIIALLGKGLTLRKDIVILTSTVGMSGGR